MKDFNKQNNKIEIGKIVKAQGIKGEVKVLPFTDSAFNFANLKYVYVADVQKELKKAYRIGNCWGLRLDGVDTCNKAEALKNKIVTIDREQFVLPEGRWLIEDLIGRPVALTTGKVLGSIADINNFGSADVISITGGSKEWLVSHKEGLITEIDEFGRVIFDAKIFEEVGIYND